MARLTLRTVNNTLGANGFAERLFKGKDYFYFAEGEASSWPASSVYVPRLNDLTLDQWLDERKELSIAARRSNAC